MLTKWNQDQEATFKKFMGKITLELAELKKQYESLQKVKSEIEESASLINTKYEEIRTRMIKLESERYQQQSYISSVEKKIQEVQESQRSAVFELRNLPLKENENNDDLIKLVTDTDKTLQVPINPTQIRDIYRIQSKKGPQKQVVVELLSVTQKNNLLQAARNYNKGKPKAQKLSTELIGLKGECVPIYISDRLSPSLRQLFYEARKFASTNDYNFCWASYGKIYLKKREGHKAIRVISDKTFQELLL